MRNLRTYDKWLLEQNGPANISVGDKLTIPNRGEVQVLSINKGLDEIIIVAKGSNGIPFKIKYDDGQDAYVVDEFEGSFGGSTQLASDLYLATQTAANGIAF